MKQTNTQVLFRREPRGFPVADDFEIVETALPDPGPGQFLGGSLFLSLDPYMRMLMGGGWTFFGAAMVPGQVMVGRVLGKVLESNNPAFTPGDHVVGRLGWQMYAVSDGSDLDFKVVPKDSIPLTAYLGACGSNGVTAWTGLKIIGEPKEGETVLVSAAAGSVGSAVGQIAKAMGCRTIGIAGARRSAGSSPASSVSTHAATTSATTWENRSGPRRPVASMCTSTASAARCWTPCCLI